MKKIKNFIAVLMICILALPVTTFAAPVENAVEVQADARATSMFQENIAVATAWSTAGQAVQYSGTHMMVSIQMSNISNSPTSLTVYLQKLEGSSWKTKATEYVDISTSVQDVFYNQEITANGTYRLYYVLNGGSGSYIEASVGIATW